MPDDSSKKTLIIDCDPGCDDALALLLAIRAYGKNYDRIIITTVSGNVSVDRTTFNAQKIASLALYGLGEVLPMIFIHKGARTSLMGTAPNVMSVHGRDGLGDVPMKLYPDPEKLQKIKVNISLSATELFKDIIDKQPETTYDLICLGPLTNIATALSLSSSPEQFIKKFQKIVIMGGAFKHRGNITPSAEYNFFTDPVAVKIFLDTLKKCEENEVLNKVVFVPLDVTEKAQLRWEDIDGKAVNAVGEWTTCMLQKYFLFHAFNAQILKKYCSNLVCAHEKLSCCEFEDSGEYKKKLNNLKNDRLVGKSGRKHLPRFSYLHDPLAVHFAMNFNLDLTNEDSITIHTDDDSMRGSVVIIDEKVSMSQRGSYTKGTKVRYLTPDKVSVKDISLFKKTLLKACEFA